ncbi:fatty acid-fatty acyl responsive DNA-binding protein [Salmonella enterica subsp. enterica serovar Paratyphi A]|nr:fatty acid-fatty acyl responsive DNA-binding protein [Salmonella enterica subsp. enterica serovar Paratyphi A]CEC32178.1 fatty acid-fatty acyl responsive DNA-binding protein [Salmonella enterica subsp. enterica serovar Paratyphi A]CEC44192.1 fatty acid-fatty acyl responsive DNA-binding protein [Salmonella enterica subsp. enterica serovar Paratyphi A]
MVIKAQSPAGFAEEYIIESIWNNRFPPGTILPAERELSELIGVTRTTLREVLQRLARDGWLTIQHGKPTKVNNFWETSGLNILETLARLDHESVPQLIDNLLSVRTNISTIFIRTALRQHPDKAQEVLATAHEVADHADAFADLDYNIFRGLAFASGNPIYGLILNGMKGLYTRIGRHYFANPEARSLALGFYHKLSSLCEQGAHDQVYETVRRYGHDSGEIWHRMQKNLPGDSGTIIPRCPVDANTTGQHLDYSVFMRGGQRSSSSTLPSSFCCSSITSKPHNRCTCFSTSLRPLSSGARLCGI